MNKVLGFDSVGQELREGDSVICTRDGDRGTVIEVAHPSRWHPTDPMCLEVKWDSGYPGAAGTDILIRLPQ